MGSDLGNSILLTMAPIAVLMIGLIVYGVMKNSKQKDGQNKRESDALIEAQAMLAKYQKEQQSQEGDKKEDSEKKKSDKEDKDSDKNTEEPKSENKSNKENKNSGKEEKDSSKEEKPQKPKAQAPVDDTTELEPDIDKIEDK